MTQVTHEYDCLYHGRFDLSVKFGDSPPNTAPCPIGILEAVSGKVREHTCLKQSPWVPPCVGIVWKI